MTRPVIKGRHDAVSWHSEIANDFDSKYTSSSTFRERRAVWTGLINKFCPTDANVLDAGCGSGVFSIIAAQRAGSVLGIDASRPMIALAEAKKQQIGLSNLAFDVATVGDTKSLKDRQFDVILCSSVFEYVDDYWLAFNWLADHLSEKGIIIFSMPNGESFYRKAEKALFYLTGQPSYYAHVRHVPELDSVCAALSARSFEVVESSYYAAVPALSRIARVLGYPQLSDSLFVVVCRRVIAPLPKSD